MRISYILILGLLCGVSLLSASQASAAIVYQDNFDDNIVTGWTFLDRNGPTEIANASWVETGGRLEQQTTNFDFPRDSGQGGGTTGTGDPVLGTIALSGSGNVGGSYTISLDMDSLEDGNAFQDQSVVFAYQDENNFLYIETSDTNNNTDSFRLNQVILGERSTVAGSVAPITFSHALTAVSVSVDTVSGVVSASYNGGADTVLATGLTIASGLNGVGSNNDAFAIDNFVITTAVPEPGSLALLGLVSLGIMGRRRK